MDLKESDELLQLFEDYLKIDESDLDSCIANHPELYFHVARSLALVTSIYDTKKQELDVLYAKLDNQIRNQYEELTESKIKQKINIDINYQSLYKEILDWKKHSNLWKALEIAFNKRSSMLRALARSHELQQTNPYVKSKEYEKQIKLLNEKRRKIPIEK